VWTHTDPKYSSNVIFDVELVKVVDDMFRYQENLIEQYIKDHGFHIDSQEDGFYFMKKTSLPDEDTIVEGTTVLVDYVGKLIENNHCFETNVVDSAKCYRIYNSARTYEGLEAVFYSDPQEFADKNSLALGFSKAISMLKIDEEAFVFFTSDWGYGADGSGAAIPPYAPLYFSIKVREND
ncbi:MAG: FKBP-type peptidyl-prolyl cis-trans isomerase, partial [Bacteroidales bacterium]|nr:FKBP-type peptidyl-prolyl cis-trans isomerase [Bacteroidales bacterium]